MLTRPETKQEGIKASPKYRMAKGNRLLYVISEEGKFRDCRDKSNYKNVCSKAHKTMKLHNLSSRMLLSAESCRKL